MSEMVDMFEWDDLEIPQEDPEQIKIRLDAIHRNLLEEKGLTTKPEKNSPGFRPSAAQAREVSVMSALGLDSADIALVLNIEEKMMKLYYVRELKVSHNLANALVARRALDMALSGRYPDMTKFWLKTRAKWKETQGVELTANIHNTHELVTAKDRLKQLINDQTPSANENIIDLN